MCEARSGRDIDVIREGKRRKRKEIRVLEDKIGFGFNTKEIALLLSTSSCRDSITKQTCNAK